MDRVRNLIVQQARERGTNLKALSTQMGRNPAYLQQFVTRGIPEELGERDRVKLAVLLGLMPDELRAEPPRTLASPAFPPGGHDWRPALDTAIPTRVEMPKDLPVFGTAQGGGANGAFELNLLGGPIDYVRRAPGIAANPRAFAIYVEGDSMMPKYRPGDLLIIDPNRKARPGDDVVFICHSPEPGNPPHSWLKEYVRDRGTAYEVLQHNPARTLTFEKAAVKELYRVLTMAEVMGV